MSISKRTTSRGEARYDVRYRGPDGKERSKTFRTRRDARDFENDQRVAMRKGTWTDPRAGRVSLAGWVERWERETVHLAPATRRIYSTNLRLHVLPDVLDAAGKVTSPALGPIEIGKLSTSQLRTWMAALTVKPRRPGSATSLAPATVHQAYRVLHQCLVSAEASGLIGRNPLDVVKPPRVEARPMRCLDPGEIDRLADAIDERYRALVLVAAYGGLRAGELLALRWENVDLAGRKVHVSEQTDIDAGPDVVKSPKTSAGRRAVSLARFVVDELEAHGRRMHEEGDGAVVHLDARPRRWSGPVFTDDAGERLNLGRWRYRHWRPAVARAGLAGLRIHDLRHTCASLAIQAGADAKSLQRMLGHASAAMTLDRYGHLMPGQAEAVADRLGELREAARRGA